MYFNRIAGCLLCLSASVTTAVQAQARYDFANMQREKLNRGVVAVRESDGKVAVSWRYLSSDPENQSFYGAQNETVDGLMVG